MDQPQRFYPIGTPGQPWGDSEREAWRACQQRQRSYADLVLAEIDSLRAVLDVSRYGEAPGAGGPFPLFALRSRHWQDRLPVALVTGGVHGYETSGVMGALAFARRHGGDYQGRLNLLIAPCVSPWAFEHIQRWNSQALDPNRSFHAGSRCAESAALMELVAPLSQQVRVHLDLHETTDSDEGEFRPALAARDGQPFEPGTIPDGFYLVDDTIAPQPEFQQAILDAVAKVTHIAPADADGELFGSAMVMPGVIRYALRDLGLCAGLTDAPYRTTTEVYPDSPGVTPEQCIEAQVAAVRAGLDFVLAA